MSDFKLRFTQQEQARYRNRVEAIERRAQRLAYREAWTPEPWSKAHYVRTSLLVELLTSFAHRRAPASPFKLGR